MSVACEIYYTEKNEIFTCKSDYKSAAASNYSNELIVQTWETERLQRFVSKSTADQFQFSVIPLCMPSFYEQIDKNRPFRASELVVSDSLCTENLVPSIRLPEQFNSDDSNLYENIFYKQFEYAQHLGFSAILVDLLNTAFSERSARCISHLLTLAESAGGQIWIRLGATEPGWKQWNMVTSLCHDNPMLKLVLDMPSAVDPILAEKFTATTVVAVSLCSDAFIANDADFPVLPRHAQEFLRRFAKTHNPSVIVRSVYDSSRFEPSHYAKYLRQICSTLPPPSTMDVFSEGYVDTLQRPLQPLMQNLSTLTYQVFESDPVKYAQYQKAVYAALCDFKSRSEAPVKLAVVGAGRGPLVTASLRAAYDAKCAVDVYAVEKNHGALVTLERMNQAVWHSSVTVVAGDMRDWSPAFELDILVSELLGSFGDNELSPECLDGAQRLLNKTRGISIPASYAAYLAPVSSQKLHNEMMAMMGSDFTNTNEAVDKLPWETPYVVRAGQASLLGTAQKCWEFVHPNFQKSSNDRYARCQFEPRTPALVHGFLGYFSCVLYKDITISIVPETHTPDMTSWFEIYFPIKVPLYLSAGCGVAANIWRRSTTAKVWYEWNMTVYDKSTLELELSPGVNFIHNPDGRTFWIGL